MNTTAKADATAGPATVSHNQSSHAHPPKQKLPSLCSDFQETVQTRVESEPPKLGNDTAVPEKPSVQEPPPSYYLPQKITPAIFEANAISGVQIMRDILYNAYDVEEWVPIRVLKDENDDSDKEYDLDYIRSCKRASYFKRNKNGDPAVSTHHGKCKFPTPIAYQTCTRLKQTDYPNYNLA